MSAIATTYFERYAIDHIALQIQAGVVESADQVCNLSLEFIAGYSVQFKLQGEQAKLGEHISGINKGGVIIPGKTGTASDLEEKLTLFFQSIESRLDRIEHEEKVQSITFLGSTFILNNKSRFDVVDDADGHLTIEMHRGDTRQSAMLLASSLLDGLYDGSIVLQP